MADLPTDGDALFAAVQHAAPAISVHNEFMTAHTAIRLHCGRRAAALDAKLTALEAECELAAMEAAEDRPMRVGGEVRE